MELSATSDYQLVVSQFGECQWVALLAQTPEVLVPWAPKRRPQTARIVSSWQLWPLLESQSYDVPQFEPPY